VAVGSASSQRAKLREAQRSRCGQVSNHRRRKPTA